MKRCYVHPERAAVDAICVPCAPDGAILVCAECATDQGLEAVAAKHFAEHATAVARQRQAEERSRWN